MRNDATVFRTLDLPGGTLVPFASAPGERVRILFGRIWLTEEGNPDDAFLASGEEVALATRGLAVIEALGPARVQLIEPVNLSRKLYDFIKRIGRKAAAAWLRQSRRRPTASASLRLC